MYAWQFAKMLYTADRHGWTRFVSMQDHYNLLYREEEREMLPLCADQGIGVIPWSPLARGRLTRGLGRRDRAQPDRRVRQAPLRRDGPGDRRRGGRRCAEPRGISRAQVALAWLLCASRSSPRRSSASPSRSQLDDALGRAVGRAEPRGDRAARRAVRAAPHRRPLSRITAPARPTSRPLTGAAATDRSAATGPGTAARRAARRSARGPVRCVSRSRTVTARSSSESKSTVTHHGVPTSSWRR